jgi:hypothetical protein
LFSPPMTGASGIFCRLSLCAREERFMSVFQMCQKAHCQRQPLHLNVGFTYRAEMARSIMGWEAR